jgi:glycosyltransferase involved in cell wall biosynthesis
MKSQLPTISIITPSYNQGQFIKQTIDSVLSQNYPKLEYWVIDGGSSDQTVKILQSYGKKINWISEKDNGQTDAINKGLQKTSGEIVAYLNSDDCFAAGTLKSVGEFFVSNKTAIWVTGDYKIIDASGTEIQSLVRKYKTFFRILELPFLIKILNYINQPSTFWRRDAMARVGMFDDSLRYCMDYDFWLRLYELQKPFLLAEQLSHFRIHGNSKGGSQYTKQFAEENLIVKRYTKNQAVLLLHKLHSFAIVQAYKLLK